MLCHHPVLRLLSGCFAHAAVCHWWCGRMQGTENPWWAVRLTGKRDVRFPLNRLITGVRIYL